MATCPAYQHLGLLERSPAVLRLDESAKIRKLLDAGYPEYRRKEQLA